MHIPRPEGYWDISNLPSPPKWEVFLAKIFGKKTFTKDGFVTVISYQWRGKNYITAIYSIIDLPTLHIKERDTADD